ncbi:F0F1 ATP synthase subunit A [Planctomycetota bacterium]
MQILAFNPLSHNQSVPVFELGPLTISNHMLMVAVTAVLLAVGIPLAVRKRAMAPRGWQNLIESVCDFIRKEVAQPILGDQTDRYIGFIWSIFFFVLTLNLLGMIPSDKLITVLTGRPNHYGGAATSNIYVTGGLALVTFFVTHACGIRQQGIGHYVSHFAPSGPWWLMPLLYVIEIISTLVKPITLAMRLFANMVAGHMVLATFVGLIIVFQSLAVAFASVGAVVAMSLLELLVAFIQAFIFTFLSALYIGFAIAPEH